jgi:hypothetical protein
MKKFRLLTASKNVNSFGLRGCILVAEDGEAWEVASNAVNMPIAGKTYNAPQAAKHVARNNAPWFSTFGWEIPRRLPTAPAAAVAQAWAKSIWKSGCEHQALVSNAKKDVLK